MMTWVSAGNVLVDVESVRLAVFVDRRFDPDGVETLKLHLSTGATETVRGRTAASVWKAIRGATLKGEIEEGSDDEELVLNALRSKPAGLTRTQIQRGCFGGHKSSEELRLLLDRMSAADLIESDGASSARGSKRHGSLWTLKVAPA